MAEGSHAQHHTEVSTHAAVCLCQVTCGHVTLFASVRGVWSCEECRAMWLQLDPTEGPNRERRRMVQVPKNIPNRFLLQQQAGPEEAGGWAGLEWWVGRVRVVGGWG